MLTPPRPHTPVPVLDRHLLRRSNLTAYDEPNLEGTAGLMGEDGRAGGQPEEMWKGINGTASFTGKELPRPSLLAVPSASQAPLSQTTYTISVQSTPSATSIPKEGARAEIEALPGQNQNRPDLDDAKAGAPALPGVNQDTSNMGEIPKPASPVAAANPLAPSVAPAITVNRPLPGQNQANPTMGDLAPPPAPSPPANVSPLPPLLPPPPLVDSPIDAPSSTSEATTSSVLSTVTSSVLSFSTISMQTSLSIPTSTLTPLPVTSFVTIMRSEQGKERPVTLALSSISSTSVTSASISPMDNATPQAVAVVQSFSGVLSSTTAIAAGTLTPTAISSPQDTSILHPTARTLLILFVILGALSVLVAIIIFVMIRSNKKRSRAQQQTMINQNPYDASSDRIGVTTHISANPNDNPFLTASEKAIIDRAASSNGDVDANNSSSISDAISLFIKKSRRLTYKISP